MKNDNDDDDAQHSKCGDEKNNVIQHSQAYIISKLSKCVAREPNQLIHKRKIKRS